jgi:transcriptional regulator CtsR
MKHERKTIAKSLHDVLQKETETPWTEEEIKRCMLTEHFTSNVINYLIETEFGRKPKDYS